MQKVTRGLLTLVLFFSLRTNVISEDIAPPPTETVPPPAETAPPVVDARPEFIGSETCLNCHQLTEHFKDSHGRSLVLKKGLTADKTCETCHGPGSLHAEAAGDKSHPGFSSLKQFSKMTNKQVSLTCLECHQDSSRIHWKGGVHESKGLSCVSCHSIHDPKSRQGLLTSATGPETCFTCHRDVKGQMRRSAHMPLLDGKMSCNDCHNPHDSGLPKQLLDNQVTNLCFRCHSEKRGPFVWEHAPVRENCLNCHHPHGTHHDKMLVQSAPLLCQRCHNASRHPATLYDNSSVNTSNNRIIGHACSNCHANIHGSNHPTGKYFAR